MTIIKKPTREVKRSNGLHLPEYFLLEKECLELIEKNYKCKCKKKRSHFPKIVKSNLHKHEFELSDQGTSIDILITKNRKIDVPDIDEQLDCILDNLNRNKIRHLDLHDSGKNLCVDKYGTISLIDFDVASIGSNYLSTSLQIRASRYGSYATYLVQAKSKMLEMVKKIMTE